jgi:putative MFS transporter
MTRPARLRRSYGEAAFWGGCALVTIGALLHVPMFLMGRATHYVLAGMPMDSGMLGGMVLIVVGVGLTAYGLLPMKLVSPGRSIVARPTEDARLGAAHWLLMAVLVAALVVDVMKPASLGFVVPGMKLEYRLSKDAAAWLPFSALTGTFVGSLVWGVLADVYGRRASILLSTIVFVGTSICGAMPSFAWNVGMCFMMGAAAGGLLPVVYALLAETAPARHRGWMLVMVGGLGAAGGYLAASGGSALLQPIFGWRIMWFLNIPTGLLLVALSGLIPESPRFLIRIGQIDQARTLLARFGARLVESPDRAASPVARRFSGARRTWLVLAALTLAGGGWSLVNFGVLLWLPADLVAQGNSIGGTSRLLAQSALFALPASLVAAMLYWRWSSKGTLLLALGVTAAGLLGLPLVGRVVLGHTVSAPELVTLLIMGSNTLLAALIPYTTELFPSAVRGRATGWVSGSTKAGGIVAQGLSLLGLVPAIGATVLALAGLLTLASLLIGRFGRETCGQGLAELEGDSEAAPIHAVAATARS